MDVRLRAALFLLLMFWAPVCSAAAATLKSGLYNDFLLVAVDGANKLTGYYSTKTGAEGQFSCIFYIKGFLKGGIADISTYFPDTPKDVIKGKLRVIDGKNLAIALLTEHGGCANVQHFADPSQPASFDLAAAHPDWKIIRVIKSKRTYFFDSAEAKTHGKNYVVQGDGVGVRNSTGSRLQVDYAQPDVKSISGWIEEKTAIRRHGRWVSH